MNNNSKWADKDYVLTAVKEKGDALKYASEELRNDKEFIFEVVKHSGKAFFWATEELRHDQYFLLDAIRENTDVEGFLPEELYNDKEFMLAAIDVDAYIFAFASPKLCNDKEVVLAAVQNGGSCLLEQASKELQNDADLILAGKLEDYRYLYYSNPEATLISLIKEEIEERMELINQIEHLEAELREIKNKTNNK